MSSSDDAVSTPLRDDDSPPTARRATRLALRAMQTHGSFAAWEAERFALGLTSAQVKVSRGRGRE